MIKDLGQTGRFPELNRAATGTKPGSNRNEAKHIWEKGVIGPRSKTSQKRPKAASWSQRDFAVTTRSLRGHYAVTTRSLRGHYAVTTVTTRSPRGHYAVKKSYTFEAEKTLNFAPKRPIRSRHCCVDLEGSDFINASNLIHYTANRFQV